MPTGAFGPGKSKNTEDYESRLLSRYFKPPSVPGVADYDYNKMNQNIYGLKSNSLYGGYAQSAQKGVGSKKPGIPKSKKPIGSKYG